MSHIRNSVQLVGHLGQEPQIRAFDSGKKVGQVSIATSDSFRDKQGTFQQRTQWHQLVAWGPQAEFLEKYLHKGSYIGIRGRLSHRKYKTAEGDEKRRTEIIVSEFVPLEKKERELPF